MNLNQLKEAKSAAPFVPFVVRMSDGREHRVPSPDFLWFAPDANRIFFIAKPGHDAASILSITHVTAISFDQNGRPESDAA